MYRLQVTLSRLGEASVGTQPIPLLSVPVERLVGVGPAFYHDVFGLQQLKWFIG